MTNRGAWLKCDDCNSTIHEVWRGRTLSIEVDHSDTCPVWPVTGAREVALAFLPKQEGDQ